MSSKPTILHVCNSLVTGSLALQPTPVNPKPVITALAYSSENLELCPTLVCAPVTHEGLVLHEDAGDQEVHLALEGVL